MHSHLPPITVQQSIIIGENMTVEFIFYHKQMTENTINVRSQIDKATLEVHTLISSSQIYHNPKGQSGLR